jgi:hypothetical protein
MVKFFGNLADTTATRCPIQHRLYEPFHVEKLPMKINLASNIKSALWFTATGLAILLGGCKSAGEKRAALKTLDSIATGTTELYQCAGNNGVPAQLASSLGKIVFDKADKKLGEMHEADKTKIRDAVKQYFTAISPEIQRVFFEGFGGSILISNRIDDLCAASRKYQALDAQSEERTEGCFAFATDIQNKGNAILTLIHRPDAKKIQYYGPQLIGYLYAQFFPRIVPSKDPGKLFDIADTEATIMHEQKRKVANSFLKDLLDRKADLGPLEKILGANGIGQIQMAASSMAKNTSETPLMDSLTFDGDPAPEARKTQLMDFFFANAFQSMHCNAKSLEVADKLFPESKANFAKVDTAILELSNTLMPGAISPKTASASVPAGGNGFALAQSGPPGMLGMLMPVLAGGGGGLGGLLGGAGGGGAGGLAALFSAFSGGKNGNWPMNSVSNNQPRIGQQNQQRNGSYSDLYSQLASAGSQGGTCPGGCCNGGSCSGCQGGSCSNCSNGNCGGCSGGCSCG